ncbi:MAG: tetratricopeptide repeat protein [Acidobacteriota bacterium]
MADREKITRRHTGPLFIALAAILAILGSVSHVGAETRLQNVRMGIHETYTRLVFDADGERASCIGPPTSDGIGIEFAGLKVGASLKKGFGESAIAGIEVREHDNHSEIYIPFKKQNTTVKFTYLPAESNGPGPYRLILDFFPSASAPPVNQARAAEPPKAESPKVEPPAVKPEPAKEIAKKTVELSAPSDVPFLPPMPFAVHAEGGEKAKTEKAQEALKKGNRGKTTSQPAVPKPPEPEYGEQSAPLYQEADALFDANQDHLENEAHQIVEKYTEALKAEPKARHAAVALYRCGLALCAVNDYNKAEKYFKEVVESFPDHPVSPQGWAGLGLIYHKKQAYLESIEAFRSALRFPMEKDVRTGIYYGLGKDLSLAGAHKEAVETLNACLTEDPRYYVKNPDIFRYLGESLFILQQYRQSREALLHYLNLQKEVEKRDVLLAKLAEILMTEGDQPLATKLYGYVKNTYPDSEGEYISMIRKAELMEKRERGQGAALTVYEELSEKPLPGPLRTLVNYKLASWNLRNGNHEQSLELVEQSLRGKLDPSKRKEFESLRDKAIVEWTKKAYSDKNYPLVIQIFDKYGPILQAQQSQEIDCAIAESYGELKLYPNAIEQYDKLLSGKKKNEDWLLKNARYTFLVGDLEKAATYSRQLQSDPYDAQKSELLGRISHQQGRYGEAVKYLTKLFPRDKEVAPADFDTFFAYVQSLVESKKYDEAVPILQKNIERLGQEESEKRMRLYLLLTKCYQESKQTPKAIEIMETLVAMNIPDEDKDGLLYELSRLYLGSGQLEKATEKLKRLLASKQPFWQLAAQQQLDGLKLGK